MAIGRLKLKGFNWGENHPRKEAKTSGIVSTSTSKAIGDID